MKTATGLEPGTSGVCSPMLYHWAISLPIYINIQLALLFDRYIKLNIYYNNKIYTNIESSKWSWTRHFWVCRPMLYHWAISLLIYTYIQLALLFDRYIKLKIYYNKKIKKIIESSKWNWTRHLWVCSPMLYHWAISLVIYAYIQLALLFDRYINLNIYMYYNKKIYI